MALGVEFSLGLGRLETAVAGRRVTPRLPRGRTFVDVDDDGGDETTDLDQADVPDDAARALFIVYRNAKGEQSHRTITVRQLIGVPPETLLAYCHMRQRPRHFRFDRILEAIDPESGEVLPLGSLAGLLAEHHDSVDPVLRRAVKVLVFMAWCDGRAVTSEWSAIDDALALYMVRFGGSDADHQRACRMAREVAPDGRDLLIAMRSFAASPDRQRIGSWLLAALRGVIDADGKHQREEFEWVERISELLALLQRPPR